MIKWGCSDASPFLFTGAWYEYIRIVLLQEEIMRIAERVYISEILKLKTDILKERVRQKKRIPGLYCITLSQWKSGILEIYSYGELLSEFYESCNMTIVGLAAGKKDALVILRRMIDDVVKYGEIENITEYFGGEKV